jgi:AAA+ ATPase superfamily predicted ATPase
MDNFINRKKEIKWLDDSYKKAYIEGQLLIVYGKRRVGKTELIKQFAKGKQSAYFVAEKGTAKDQLRTATGVIADGLDDEVMRDLSFSSWRDMFRYVGSRLEGRKDPLVLVFDEFPYLVESDGAMSSYFQIGWDEFLKTKKIVMVLMGSSISMMYKHALAYSAPLYGRRTGQWLLEPFSYAESKEFYPVGRPFMKTFSLYAITGGIPAYARVFWSRKSLERNIRVFVLPEGSFLSVEPELLLSEEFTDPRSYLSILKAIGLGRTKFSEIVSATGLESTAMTGYLQTLIDLRLIKKEFPITDKLAEKSKKGSYSLADSFLRFYFSFIYPNSSLIKSGNVDELFRRYGNILVQLVAKSYEDATAQFIRSAIGDRRLPHFNELGRWWDKNTEIDLVGLNEYDNSILFVETKWTNRSIKPSVLLDLKQKSKQVIWGKPDRKEYFALVSKSGFSSELHDLAEREGVLLIAEDGIKLRG